MKCRKGFVSNSSSSSFALGVEPGQQEVALVVKMDIKNSERLITVAELDDWFWKEHARFEYESLEEALADEGATYLKEMYGVMRVALEAGKHIVFGSASNDYDDAIGLYLYCAGFPETVGAEVLVSEM